MICNCNTGDEPRGCCDDEPRGCKCTGDPSSCVCGEPRDCLVPVPPVLLCTGWLEKEARMCEQPAVFLMAGGSMCEKHGRLMAAQIAKARSTPKLLAAR
jgi:hypothetical protein